MAKQRRSSLFQRAREALICTLSRKGESRLMLTPWVTRWLPRPKEFLVVWVIECDHDAINECIVDDGGATHCECDRKTWQRVGERFNGYRGKSVRPMLPRSLEHCIDSFNRKRNFIQLMMKAGTASWRIRNIITGETIPMEAIM